MEALEGPPPPAPKLLPCDWRAIASHSGGSFSVGLDALHGVLRIVGEMGDIALMVVMEQAAELIVVRTMLRAEVEAGRDEN